jgi:hypothetical protein
MAVKLAVMGAANWDYELVARLATECTRLCEAEMVRIARLTSTDEAWLRRDEVAVGFVAIAARFA